MAKMKLMPKPVALYCWHFMAYPHLPADFDETYDTGWVTVPNRLRDAVYFDRLRPGYFYFFAFDCSEVT